MLATALSGLALAPGGRAVAPSLDLDKDGLDDGLEQQIGLTPGRFDRIGFVDQASKKPCSDHAREGRASSPSRPWCSLASALEGAPAGSTVLVRRGAYRRATLLSAGRRVRLIAYPGERVVLRGLTISKGGLSIAGFRITATVEISGGARRVSLVDNGFAPAGTAINLRAGARKVLLARNRITQRRGAGSANAVNFSSAPDLPPIADVTIRDNRIGPLRGGGDAIQAKHTRRLVVEDNEIFGVRRRSGSKAHPDVFQSLFGAEDLVLRGNFIHDIAAQGIFVQRLRGANRRLRIEDNVIARVAYPWVALSFSARGAQLAHNTLLGATRVGPSSRRAVLVGNIIATLDLPGGAGALRDYRNLVGRSTGRAGHGNIAGGPAFRDARRNDFRLVPGSRGSGQAPNGADVGSRRGNRSRRA